MKIRENKYKYEYKKNKKKGGGKGVISELTRVRSLFKLRKTLHFLIDLRSAMSSGYHSATFKRALTTIIFFIND